MKISIASDHRGVAFKSRLKTFLESLGHEVLDCGSHAEESCDYPDFMIPAAEAVSSGSCDFAVGICHTGNGSAIAANKVKGVRAALCEDNERARLSREHNDSNMLILASGFHSEDTLLEITQHWLEASFEGGRHEQRVNKIKEYEQRI